MAISKIGTSSIDQSTPQQIGGITVGRGAGDVSTNTAVGTSALAANTTGATNTAVGNTALQANTTGINNSALGHAALVANLGGSENSAYGSTALVSNTSGNYNTAVGRAALYSNTTASRNTAVGYQAGYTNSTSASNTIIGYQAGYNITGASNVFVGDSAGYTASSGTLNTFLGNGAGYSITTGSKNTILGGYSGNQGGVDIRTSSNYIVLSDGDGNPRGYFNDTGDFYNTGGGIHAAPATGTNYALFQAQNSGGNFYLAIDNSSGGVFGNGAYVRNIYSSGSYRIYVTASSAGVYLAPAGTSWTSASDERFKTDLTPIENGLDKVCTLRSVTGRYVTDEDGTSRSFLIAQDVQAVLPEAVDASDPEKLGVQYTDTIPLLVAAIKELNAKVEAQAAEIAALKGTN